jgi:predicted GNAT family acetyltransferase
MSYEGRELRVGAIGGVCTGPEHRGKGFAKKLLEDCTQFMKQNGFHASLLFGRPEIYGKCGWETLSAYGISSNFKLKTSSGAQIQKTSMENDIEWLSEIYENHFKDQTGPFKRTLEYWKKWVNWKVNIKQTHSIITVSENGAKLGYYVLKKNNTVCELCWDKNIDGSFEKTVSAIFENSEEETVKFSFFTQRLFDFICDNSQPPTLDMMENDKYFISKDALYCGLFKLIDRRGTGLDSTTDFNNKLRMQNYTFWDLDHF